MYRARFMPRNGTGAIVISPTRELALQVCLQWNIQQQGGGGRQSPSSLPLLLARMLYALHARVQLPLQHMLRRHGLHAVCLVSDASCVVTLVWHSMSTDLRCCQRPDALPLPDTRLGDGRCQQVRPALLNACQGLACVHLVWVRGAVHSITTQGFSALMQRQQQQQQQSLLSVPSCSSRRLQSGALPPLAAHYVTALCTKLSLRFDCGVQAH
jgi:hypothetical protein